jgi:hypothetical protein
MPKLDPNATLVERIQYYVQTMQIDKGKALAQLGDYLEECYLWDVSFEDEAA